MLVHCAVCGAAHQLKTQHLPAAGVRVKCSACGNEIEVHAPKAPPQMVSLLGNEAPPQVAPAQSSRSDQGRKKRKRRRRNVNRDRTSGKDGSAKTLSTPRSNEKSVAEEPSIMIDMGQISSAEVPTPGPRPGEIAAEDTGRKDPSLVFAPLSSAPSLPERAHSGHVRVTAFDVPDLDAEAVTPPRMGRAAFLMSLVLLLGLVGFIWARNGWGPIWESPEAAVRLAFGVVPVQVGADERPVEPAPAADPVPTGALTISEVSVRYVRQPGSKYHAAIVDGRLVNTKAVAQTHINIRARLKRDGVEYYSRTFGCCESFESAQALKIAENPKDPHFSKVIRGANTRLEPMGEVEFTVIFRDIKSREGLVPEAVVSFHEPAPITR